jgi:hypothetical protein
MSGKHALRVACFVVLAIVMPYAVTLPPPEPSLLKGEGKAVRRLICHEGISPSPHGGGRLGWGGSLASLCRRCSPPPSPSPVEGEGIPLSSHHEICVERHWGEDWLGRLHHRLGRYGMWYRAFGAAEAQAAEPALLRVSLAKPGPVLVGEHVTIIVELLTTTTFASAPAFEFPKIPGALLMKPEEHPVLGTEQIDGESYTVQRHELVLFVMRPGVAQIPPFTVRFESPPRFGEKAVERRLTTPALQVEARMPPGAEDLPGLIAARELRVDQTWHPQPQKARVGDAFTRTVTLTAPDVPGMVFPPLPLDKVDGLAVYAKPPAVEDQVERGELTGKRVETVTYVCERPGQFSLPALVIPWWDLTNQQLTRVTLPAVTLEVEPGPVQSTDATAPAEEGSGRSWLRWALGSVLLLVAAMAVVWHNRRVLLAAWGRRHVQRQASEAGFFAQLLDACRANDAKAAYNALLRWLDAHQRGPGTATIEAFLVSHPDADLRRQVEMLQDSVLGRATGWDGVTLADALRRVRRQSAEGNAVVDRGRLPPLNPV